MYYIGAKDNIDKALVRQYANTQTSNFDTDIKIEPDEMWEKINLLSINQKSHFDLIKNLKKAS